MFRYNRCFSRRAAEAELASLVLRYNFQISCLELFIPGIKTQSGVHISSHCFIPVFYVQCLLFALPSQPFPLAAIFLSAWPPHLSSCAVGGPSAVSPSAQVRLGFFSFRRPKPLNELDQPWRAGLLSFYAELLSFAFFPGTQDISVAQTPALTSIFVLTCNFELCLELLRVPVV